MRRAPGGRECKRTIAHRSGHALRGEQLENRWLLAGLHAVGPDQQATIAPDGQPGDQQTSIIYDAATGRMEVDAPAGLELTWINIQSAAGIFTGDRAVNLGGAFDIDRDTTIFKVIFGGSFGSLTFGNVAQPMLDRATLLEDLTVSGSIAGSLLDLGDVDLVYISSGPPVDEVSAGQVGDQQTSIIYDAATGRRGGGRAGGSRADVDQHRVGCGHLHGGFGGESGRSV